MADPAKPLNAYQRAEQRIAAGLGRLFAPRMGIWLYLSLFLLVVVWWFAEHMLKVVLYKTVLITIAAFVGDKIARFMEGSNLRPHELLELAAKAGTAAEGEHLERRADGIYLRRAVIISAAMVAAALGS